MAAAMVLPSEMIICSAQMMADEEGPLMQQESIRCVQSGVLLSRQQCLQRAEEEARCHFWQLIIGSEAGSPHHVQSGMDRSLAVSNDI